jgi:hypothetical protein
VQQDFGATASEQAQCDLMTLDRYQSPDGVFYAIVFQDIAHSQGGIVGLCFA